MCGVCALVHLDGKPAAAATVNAMNAAAHHRGPNGTRSLCVGSVGLGHTRLSIIDVAEQSNQPMEREGHFLCYNGEIYNYLELRETLETKGHHFVTNSDTEVLLVALIEWGREALDRLCGMFAFAWYNARKGEIWVVRDRFGIKPLVWARAGRTVLFASEAKQILASGLITPELNSFSAMAYLAHGALNTVRATFFAGIEEIGPGEMVVLSLAEGTFKNETWYRLSDRIAVLRLGYHEAVEAVRQRLKTSIARHHRSDVPLGYCLSGGIDSSVIVTLSRTLFPDKDLSAISIFASYEGYNETHFSCSVAEANRVRLIQVEVDTQRVWDRGLHEELGYYQDQPIPSGSHYNEYLAFKTARENGFTVMLDGQGADEYFGGYGDFWFAAQYEMLRAGHLGAFHAGLMANAETMKRSMRAEYTNYFMALCRASRHAPQAIGPISGQWLRNFPAIHLSRGLRDFRSLSLEQIGTSSIPYQLHSDDRNSMRWSIESRVPFLDHELVEFVMGLPTAYKVGTGYRKRILRDAVPELPAQIAKRKDKIGFASPDAIALRGREATVRDSLRDALENLGDMIDGVVLLARFDQMVSRHSWYAPEFLRVIALDGWRRAHGVTI